MSNAERHAIWFRTDGKQRAYTIRNPFGTGAVSITLCRSDYAEVEPICFWVSPTDDTISVLFRSTPPAERLCAEIRPKQRLG